MPPKNENGTYIDAIFEPLPEITYDTEPVNKERESDTLKMSGEITFNVELPKKLRRELEKSRRRFRRELRWVKIKARVRMLFCRHDYEWRDLGPENEIHICRKCGKIAAKRHLAREKENGE